MGGLKQTDPDEAVEGAIEKQEREREKAAYERGRARHQSNQKRPDKPGGPSEDGYGDMTEREKAAYKKGHGGG